MQTNTPNKPIHIEEPSGLYSILAAITLSALIFMSLNWNLSSIQEDKHELALSRAHSTWEQNRDIIHWATEQGGIYVKPTNRTPPSPYLGYIKNRDVTTTEGTNLTLINPAYMLRQISEKHANRSGIKAKLTGKVVINPGNRPSEWERHALEQLQQGSKEVVANSEIGGQSYLRLMKPMYMKKDCEACHGHLGFKDGDLRGGFSISIPLQPYLDAAADTELTVITTHLLIWFLGIVSILTMLIKSRQRNSERRKLGEALISQRLSLEDTVLQRTEELHKKQLEAEESKDRLEKILANTVDPFICIDEQGIIETFNAASEKAFQYSAKEAIGKNISMLMPDAIAAHHDGYIQRYLTIGEKRIIGLGREVIAKRKDQSEFPVSLSVSELLIGNKRIFTGVVHDISDRKKAELELIRSKDIAEKANLAKSEFLSSMSNELRTPLNSILGFAQLLTINPETSLSDAQGESVEHIISSGKQLLELINDVLDMAEVEAGLAELTNEEVDINQSIEHCLTLIKDDAEKQNIQISNKCSYKSNSLVYGDRIRIKQILMHLLDNAIKYNKPYGEIFIDHHLKDDKTLHLEIKDTGIGIAENLQHLIFTPFNRLGVEYSEIQGAGIGLCVSKDLLKLMSGDIGFSSSKNTGSTFWIELPVSQSRAEKPRLISETVETLERNSLSNVSGTVLYIEDNETNIKLMKGLIAKLEGLSLITATTAEEGIDIARMQQPQLIIIDINLPGISGLEARAVLADDPATREIPAIALSAAATNNDIELGIKAGFQQYLTKPLNIAELLDIFKKYI